MQGECWCKLKSNNGYIWSAGSWKKRYIHNIDWKDFKKWVELNRLDIVIFNEQQSWDIILKIQQSDMSIIIGAIIILPRQHPFFGYMISFYVIRADTIVFLNPIRRHGIYRGVWI